MPHYARALLEYNDDSDADGDYSTASTRRICRRGYISPHPNEAAVGRIRWLEVMQYRVRHFSFNFFADQAGSSFRRLSRSPSSVRREPI